MTVSQILSVISHLANHIWTRMVIERNEYLPICFEQEWSQARNWRSENIWRESKNDRNISKENEKRTPRKVLCSKFKRFSETVSDWIWVYYVSIYIERDKENKVYHHVSMDRIEVISVEVIFVIFINITGRGVRCLFDILA